MSEFCINNKNIDLNILLKGGIKITTDCPINIDTDSNGIIDKNEISIFFDNLNRYAQKDNKKNELSDKEAKKFLKDFTPKNSKFSINDLYEFIDCLLNKSKNIKDSRITEEQNTGKIIAIEYTDGKIETIYPDNSSEVKYSEISEDGNPITVIEYFDSNQKIVKKCITQEIEKDYSQESIIIYNNDGSKNETITEGCYKQTINYNSNGFRLDNKCAGPDWITHIRYDGQGNTKIYLQEDETISDICTQFNCTEDEILRLNNGEFPSVPGAALLIPGEMTIADYASRKNNGYILAEKLNSSLSPDYYRENRYLSISNDTEKDIYNINSNNIADIFNYFPVINSNGFIKLNPTKFGLGINHNIISYIAENPNISMDKKEEYLNHIKKAFIDYTKENNQYSKEMEEYVDKEINYIINVQYGKDVPYTRYGDHLAAFMINVFERSINDNKKEISNANGKLDKDFSQNYLSADCWLTATLKGVTQCPNALEILNDCLEVSENGDVTVYLKGVNKSYVITKEEIEASNNMAKGDSDVRAIEIAINKYYQEEHNCWNASILGGGHAIDAYKILFGIDIEYDTFSENALTREMIEEYNNPNSINVFGFHGRPVEYTDPNGNVKKIYPGHAYTILNFDKLTNSVTLWNGMEGEVEELKVPIDIYIANFKECDVQSMVIA